MLKHCLYLTIFLSFSCKKDKDIIKHERLVSYSYITTITKQQVLDNFPEQADYLQSITSIPKYDIKIYSFIYHSTYKNEPINLSGLMMVPISEERLSVVTYLHGTMKPYPLPEGEGTEDVPSIYHGEYPDTPWKQGETRLFGSFTASHGFITILPDYAGYAASANVPHPYSINRELAIESVDAILAAKEMIVKEDISSTDKVFLSGWSEGAAVALATQKLIETNYLDEIDLVASANFAGAYDMKTNGELIVALPISFWEWDPHELDDNLWALYATNKFADQPLPWERIFKFDVIDETNVMKGRPSNIPTEILQSSFVGNSFIKEEFRKNDLIIGWHPLRKTFLYYGTKDTNVFPFNSVNAYNTFRNKGSDITLIEFNGDDHYTPVLKYYLDMIQTFDNLN